MGVLIGAIVLLSLDFAITWGAVHAIMELGQLAGAYAWEPTFVVSVCVAAAVKLVRMIL